MGLRTKLYHFLYDPRQAKQMPHTKPKVLLSSQSYRMSRADLIAEAYYRVIKPFVKFSIYFGMWLFFGGMVFWSNPEAFQILTVVFLFLCFSLWVRWFFSINRAEGDLRGKESFYINEQIKMQNRYRTKNRRNIRK